LYVTADSAQCLCGAEHCGRAINDINAAILSVFNYQGPIKAWGCTQHKYMRQVPIKLLVGMEQAGRAAGMTAVCIPTALAGRYKPPSSQANFDGFGVGGGATWRRIKGLVEKHSR
jgi:hypothetical protein